MLRMAQLCVMVLMVLDVYNLIIGSRYEGLAEVRARARVCVLVYVYALYILVVCV